MQPYGIVYLWRNDPEVRRQGKVLLKLALGLGLAILIILALVVLLKYSRGDQIFMH